MADPLLVAMVEKRARSDARAHRDNAALQVRDGLALLRSAEVGDGYLFDRARKIFSDASRMAPEWAYPWFGMALAESGKGAWLARNPANLGTRVGYGSYQAAVKLLQSTLRIEPGFTPALLRLYTLSNVLRDSVLSSQILEAHRLAIANGNPDSEVLVNLGRLERAVGDLDSASAAFRKATGPSQIVPQAELELARTQLALHSPDGLGLYYTAAASNDTAVVGQIRSDLATITSDSSLREFDQTSGEGRIAFLKEFWASRDREDLRPSGDRIAEHYRRLIYARRNFPLSINRRNYGSADVYRSTQGEIDDRGVVYIRQGAPDVRLHPMIFGLMPNETWVYHRADGDLVMHFSAGGEKMEGGDLADYRLVGSLLDLRGLTNAPLDMVLLSRESVSDLYMKIMSWGPHGAVHAAQEERSLATHGAETATSSDSHELQFRNSLDAATDLVSIGREGGSALLHIVFAVRDSASSPAEMSNRTDVGVRFSLIREEEGAMIDTTVSARVNPLGDLVGHLAVRASAGVWQYRLAISRGPDWGRVFPRGSITIPAIAQAELQVTDLAIGHRATGAIWNATPGDSVYLDPERRFRSNEELELYYEIRGLDQGELFETSIEVRDRQKETIGRSRLRYTSREQADASVTRQHRVIRLAELKEGEYWLEVNLRDSHGRTQTSRGRFSVIRTISGNLRGHRLTSQ